MSKFYWGSEPVDCHLVVKSPQIHWFWLDSYIFFCGMSILFGEKNGILTDVITYTKMAIVLWYFRQSRPSNYWFLGSRLTEKTQIKYGRPCQVQPILLSFWDFGCLTNSTLSRAGPGHRQYRQMLGALPSMGAAKNGGRK